MSATWIAEDIKERRSSKDERLARTYTRVIYVRMSSQQDGPRGARLALTTGGVAPLNEAIDFGTSHPYPASGSTAADPQAFVRSVDIDPTDSPFVFKCTIHYSTADFTADVDQAANPLARDPVIAWSFGSREEVLTEDAIERIPDPGHPGQTIPKPILNTANKAFDPPAMQVTHTPILTYTRNEEDVDSGSGYIQFDVGRIATYVGTVNSAPFLQSGGNPWPQPRQALMNNISAAKRFESGVWYWEVTYEIHFKAGIYIEPVPPAEGYWTGWMLRILNQGWEQLLDGELKKCRDAEGNEVSQPVPLDAAGQQIPEGDLPGKAIYVLVNAYREEPFDALQLAL